MTPNQPHMMQVAALLRQQTIDQAIKTELVAALQRLLELYCQYEEQDGPIEKSARAALANATKNAP